MPLYDNVQFFYNGYHHLCTGLLLLKYQTVIYNVSGLHQHHITGSGTLG